MDLKKIIAALDFGPDTGKILAYTMWFAGMASAEGSIRLLHVMDYALTPPAYLQSYIEEEERQNRARLKQLAVTLSEKVPMIGCDVVLGRLVEAFDTFLSEQHVDILVMGHKSHLFRPSSSERLIRSLQQSMLVVRGAKSDGAVVGSVKIEKILCPVDFSAGSVKSLEWAGSLAEMNNSELIVFHVVADSCLQPDMLKRLNAEDKERYPGETLSDAEKWLAGLLSGMGEVRQIVRRGDPSAAISDAGRDMDIDLIVMGARGSTFLGGILLGGVSESVVRSSSCPVVIVH